jgi:hypothetical protein
MPLFFSVPNKRLKAMLFLGSKYFWIGIAKALWINLALFYLTTPE